jgi:hypothetical protein
MSPKLLFLLLWCFIIGRLIRNAYNYSPEKPLPLLSESLSRAISSCHQGVEYLHTLMPPLSEKWDIATSTTSMYLEAARDWLSTLEDHSECPEELESSLDQLLYSTLSVRPNLMAFLLMLIAIMRNDRTVLFLSLSLQAIVMLMRRLM